MSTSTFLTSGADTSRRDWSAVLRELGPRFAARAAQHDADDSFVAENYAELREARLFSAGVPAALGGGGASHADLAALLRELARYCGSTALAFSMHTHQVAVAAWRWEHERGLMEALLRRVGAEELVLVSSGGSDWLQSSARAERVDGGYRVTGRKIFASGCPSGHLLITSAVLDDAEAGPTVLHFPAPLDAPGISVLDTWHTLGMRGTGSHDLRFEDVFVPEGAIGGRRPQGVWHHLFHLTAMLALPLIYSAYVGLAEAARDLAVRAAMPKREDATVQLLVGELDNELAVARMALDRMLDNAARETPDFATTNTALVARTITGRAVLRVVDKALEVTGGGSFYRALGLERIFRDAQGARFHPLQEKPQLRYTGRLALGLDVDG